MSIPSVAAVIPVRMSDVCHADGSAKVILGGRPLWTYTIEAAVQASSLQRIIVAADNPQFFDHLGRDQKLAHPVLRPSYLSASDRTTLDVLAYVSARLGEGGYVPDYYMLLEITHPVRPDAIIDRLIEIVSKTAVDSLFTAHVGSYNYWYETEEAGFARVQVKSGHTRSPMYQEMIGLASLFRPSLLKTDDPYGSKVGIVPIKRLEGLIDARDENGLWLAEQYLLAQGLRDSTGKR